MALVGGSSVGYGFNSNLIQDSLKVTVAKKGDIIILSPEYYHFFKEFDNSQLGLAEIILKIDPSKIRHLNFNQIISVINNVPGYIKNRILERVKIIEKAIT